MVNSVVVVSDLHCGCRMGLCPPVGAALDDGGTYEVSPLQRKLWTHWRDFWRWVRELDGPYDVVINGDIVDGAGVRGSVHQWSHNLQDQSACAVQVIRTIPLRGRLFIVRGTEAHVSKSAQAEEEIARTVGAVPNASGQHSRWDLWLRMGKQGLVHFLHHIGTTASSAHEASAVNAELTAEFQEAARWREDPPDVVVRSHRHRFIEVRIATARGRATAVVTPGWQGKTPFAWRIAGARLAPAQWGGIVIRDHKEGLYVAAKVWASGRSPAE